MIRLSNMVPEDYETPELRAAIIETLKGMESKRLPMKLAKLKKRFDKVLSKKNPTKHRLLYQDVMTELNKIKPDALNDELTELQIHTFTYLKVMKEVIDAKARAWAKEIGMELPKNA